MAATTEMPPTKVDPRDRESVAALASRAGREPLQMKYVTEGVDPKAIARKPRRHGFFARIRIAMRVRRNRSPV